jgi:hypothetical protein
MSNTLFKIELSDIHWLDRFDDPDDRCAHGKVKVIINDEIVCENSSEEFDRYNLTASALHLLRTLELDHLENDKLMDYLITAEGHHIDHLENNPIVHIETEYPMGGGTSWQVRHEDDKVILTTETANEISIDFNIYKTEVLRFVDQVERFYNESSSKKQPSIEYDKVAYEKLWAEWNARRAKWK